MDSIISQDSKEEKTHFSHYSADDIDTIEMKEFVEFFQSQLSGVKLQFKDLVVKTLSFLLETKRRIINPTALTLNNIRLEGPSPHLYLGE